MNVVFLIENFYNFNCPHCNTEIIVHNNDLKCQIFRHAVYKHNYEQVDPHMNKELCDILVKNDLVYGCCKPFEIKYIDNIMYALICEYK